MTHKKLLFSVLLIILSQSAIVLDQLNTGITTVNSRVTNILTDIVDPIIVKPILSQEADVYFGSTEVTIENGDYKKIEFYGTFFSDNSSCAYSRCFYGWINNYTVLGEETVIGYSNESLLIKPVFEFKTNSEKDFVIVRNQNLDETWVQMIEILCEKINPQITHGDILSDRAQTSAQNLKFDFKTVPTNFDLSQSLPTSDQIQKPEDSIKPKYQFQTIQQTDFLGGQTLSFNNDLFKLYGAVVGDKFSRTSQNILLDDIKTSNSAATQTLLLSKDDLIKTRALEYQIKLPSTASISQNGQKVSDFFGKVQINFKHAQKTKVASTQGQKIKELLNIKTRALFDFNSIERRRAKLAQILEPEINTIIDQGPSYEQAEIFSFPNQKFSGVNVIDQFNAPGSVINPNTAVSLNQFTRNLQVLQNYTVYNYKKTLFSTTIFGKTFKTQVDVKCYILVFSNDQQIQCLGTLNYQIFGKVKSISIFSFKKSVSYAWSWSKQFKGSWAFSVYIPLPPPVSFIGLTFRFSVSYVIDVKININAGGISPYQVKAVCLASTKVNTDASAGVRVIAIEGGVFISGTLVQVGTDPRVTLSYYFEKKYINVLAQWYFWISAFKYNWGFYYRTWRLFKGWSSRKIIKQWTINGVYGKWVIVNKSWNIYL